MNMKKLLRVILICTVLVTLGRIKTFASTISSDDTSFYAITENNSLMKHEFDNPDGYQKILDDVIDVSRNYAVKYDGTLWTWSDSVFGTFNNPEQVMSEVKTVEASENFIFIIKNDNSLWAVGNNDFFRMGLSDYEIDTKEPIKIMNNVIKAVPGLWHSEILKTDGRIITTGLNTWGVLGIGQKKEINMPRAFPQLDNVTDIYVGEDSSFALKNNDLWAWGSVYAFAEDYSVFYQCSPELCETGVKQVRVFPGYIFCLMQSGDLYVRGIADEKETVVGLANGGMLFHLPQLIMNNVYAVSDGWSKDRIGDHRALILSEDGDIYEYTLRRWEEPIFAPEILKCQIDSVKMPVEKKIIDHKKYSDVENSIYNKEINSLTKAGIFIGITDTEFMPDKAISRAEAAALLLRMVGKGGESENCMYTDVTADKWYYGIIGASQKYGIIEGYDDNTFRSEEPVSDLQLAVLAARTLRSEGTAIAPDNEKAIVVPDNIPSWAADDITYAIKYGIITKEEAGKLSDENAATRGEAAVILYCLYNII